MLTTAPAAPLTFLILGLFALNLAAAVAAKCAATAADTAALSALRAVHATLWGAAQLACLAIKVLDTAPGTAQEDVFLQQAGAATATAQAAVAAVDWQAVQAVQQQLGFVLKWLAWAQQHAELVEVLHEFFKCVANGLSGRRGPRNDSNDAGAVRTALEEGRGLLESKAFWHRPESSMLRSSVVDLVGVTVVAYSSSDSPARSCLTQDTLESVSQQQQAALPGRQRGSRCCHPGSCTAVASGSAVAG